MRKPWCEDCLKNSASIGSTVHLRGSAAAVVVLDLERARAEQVAVAAAALARRAWRRGVGGRAGADTLNERPRLAVNVPRPAASTR